MAFAPPATGLLAQSRAVQRSRDRDRGAAGIVAAPGTAALARAVSERVIQPRLLVGPSDDSFEREAERTAHAVTAVEPSRGSGMLGSAAGGTAFIAFEQARVTRANRCVVAAERTL
jgi:hypothetical protein